jgi:hypothetical protein
MVPSDPSLRAAGLRVDEWSIVRFDGREQAIAMRLESSAAFDRAALIVPLPAEAELALGDDAVFGELAERTKPRVETKQRYTFLGGGDGDEGAAPEGAGAAAVEVVGAEDLGPLRVVTLRGESGLLVRTWLQDHGFEPPEGIELGAQPYLDKGWVLAAVRLRGARGREVRRLQPLVMRFPTRTPVYPMMGNAGDTQGAEVRVDVVAPHPVAVRGRPSGDVGVEDRTKEGRIFAGPLPGGRYLTTFRFRGGGGGDAAFVPAERRDFRQVRFVYEEVDVTGRVLAALFGGLAILAAAVVLFVRRSAR